jgi:hypothetical protein
MLEVKNIVPLGTTKHAGETAKTKVDAPKTAKTKKSGADAEKVFDATFASMPKTSRILDAGLIADITKQVTTDPVDARRRESERTRAVLDQADQEIEDAAEAQRQRAAEDAQMMLRNAHVSSAAARASVEAKKAADAGVTPLASNVVALPSAMAPVNVSARRSARMGLDANQLETRLAAKLNGAMV